MDRAQVSPELAPSEWVRRWAHLVPAHANVLDLACGKGRHARYFAERSACVWAVDRDAGALQSIDGLTRVRTLCLDLEGEEWPLLGQRFDAIVVTNYLFRPRLEDLLKLLDRAGVLIYETFMLGNEFFGPPRNPEFLLREDELLHWASGRLKVVAFEQGRVEFPRPGMVQRICARGPMAEWVSLNFKTERP